MVYAVEIPPGAQVLAVTANWVALAVPDPARVLVLGEGGMRSGEYPVPDLGGLTGERAAVTEIGDDAIRWFPGSATTALGTVDPRPMWTITGALGPGSRSATGCLSRCPRDWPRSTRPPAR
ncbi:hypothetical protein [Actinokineospora sp. NBRC 105648]|uniref:hypothetical protein n=1 Tax=Actinokineospora sp. NBRC 105648 TaxID=3032206 RepID=UPI0024A3BD35|nr:hypothetical protein [Actinokineospora sp. NBRC 105648]GLZ36903.1 hypothetical protein Acsp05_05280 [Actinokineospora sp. NBRC 105648]